MRWTRHVARIGKRVKDFAEDTEEGREFLGYLSAEDMIILKLILQI
jgi:hypothetical protein